MKVFWNVIKPGEAQTMISKRKKDQSFYYYVSTAGVKEDERTRSRPMRGVGRLVAQSAF